MNELLSKLFSPTDSPSMMRVMSLIALVAGCLIAFVGMFMGKDLMGLSALCGVFVGSAFAGKVAQKAQETK